MKKHDSQHILGKKHDWQHILETNMISNTFWEKNMIGSTFWVKNKVLPIVYFAECAVNQDCLFPECAANHIVS
jgi:hypothetical protein